MSDTEPGCWAVVAGGIVQNVILLHDPADIEWEDGHEPIQLADGQAVSPGDTYDGQAFTPALVEPAPPGPPTVEQQLANLKAQNLALINTTGALLDIVMGM